MCRKYWCHGVGFPATVLPLPNHHLLGWATIQLNPASASGMALPLTPGGLQVVIVSVTFTIPPLVAIVLRIWARCLMKKPLAFNDYMAIIAMVLAAGFVSLTIASRLSRFHIELQLVGRSC